MSQFGALDPGMNNLPRCHGSMHVSFSPRYKRRKEGGCTAFRARKRVRWESGRGGERKGTWKGRGVAEQKAIKMSALQRMSRI